MKKSLFILLFICLTIGVFAQSSSITIKSKGATENKYVTIKGYEITETQEYNYIFSHQSSYQIIIKSGKKKDISVKIYDTSRKEVFSNYNKGKKKYYNDIIFKCPQTGIYYVKVSPITG